eukprot:4872521-Pleurochrysis_carterae.AAC.3
MRWRRARRAYSAQTPMPTAAQHGVRMLQTACIWAVDARRAAQRTPQCGICGLSAPLRMLVTSSESEI